ncbi:hypothetical protein RHSIM_Rhsim13G0234900 [Rhododendron simsii]|uniref:Integrase catalytic domain-containing protein n=1 Tax=Rhododendron simsii TaxID=118357 RepID=A0A834L5L5_RHOSS|nr:hypothetical protein RHSIM_Rhsim13G0234900 [Rhododendron simsii]
MEARRDKGLCYNCDEKYVRGHRCQRRQLYLLVGEDEEPPDTEPGVVIEEVIPPWNDMQISMHAISGSTSFRTMRVTGKVKGRTITILIDSGSTHNFVEPGVVKSSGHVVEPTPELPVTVANGTKMSNKGVCAAFTWEMQGEVFTTEVRVLAIGGCDMVLGVQWLSNLGPILWDFKNLQMQFQVADHPFLLKGNSGCKVEQMNSKQVGRALQQTNQGCMIQLFSLTAPTEDPEVQPDIAAILHDFDDIFTEPKSLPPQRDIDHRIPLQVGSEPVHGYGKICAPLTQLLKKDAFGWNEEAEGAFQTLKTAMVTTPVLALPDYTKTFILECDASGIGMGAVLMQEGHPIAFISKALAPKHLGLSTYEKELMAVVYAVKKWGHYLLGRHFIIRTDHFSLKYLLDQKISTTMQQKWLTQLLGYDYEIMFKAGQDNKVADALSRYGIREEGNLLALSVVQTDWLNSLKLGWQTDPALKAIIEELSNDPTSNEGYNLSQGVLTYKGRLVVNSDAQLRAFIMQEIHATPLGGHSGTEKTYRRAKRSFYWKGMRKELFAFVANCDTCQRNKTETVAVPGLLQPLPILERVWTDISMDFVEGLPSSQGKTVIFVVVDRLSKYAHFIALSHPYTAIEVAQSFMDSIFRLHGMPKSIVSDRDPVFTSGFWQNSSGERPRAWVQWLPLAEWWFNTNYHTATKLTPYQVVYGQVPPSHIHYIPGASNVAAVDQWGSTREATLRLLKEHLTQAQNRMKQQADQHRSNMKLSPRFYGPFQVLKRIGQVAYQLELPAQAKIHPVFHVSLLKRKLGTHVVPQSTLPPVDTDGILEPEPVAVLDRRLVKFKGRPATQFLVQWSNSYPEDATWEFYQQLKDKYPAFQPCGQGSSQGGGNDRPVTTYGLVGAQAHDSWTSPRPKTTATKHQIQPKAQHCD